MNNQNINLNSCRKSIFFIFLFFCIFFNASYCQYDNAIDRGGSYEWDDSETSGWSIIAKGIEILFIPACIILVIIGLGRDIEKSKDKRKEKKEKLKDDLEFVNRFMKEQRRLNNPSSIIIIGKLEELYRDGKITKVEFEEQKKIVEDNY